MTYINLTKRTTNARSLQISLELRNEDLGDNMLSANGL
jgi:hypothetical protein